VGWDVVKDVIEKALVQNAEIDVGTAKMTLLQQRFDRLWSR
jgi:hypothetical protein